MVLVGAYEHQRRENQENQPGELQLVLDPELL
jgi:hypothetical protein